MILLQLLGPLRLQVMSAELHLPIRKSQALLVLLGRGGASARQALCSLLWPGQHESAARRNLRRELVRLRELSGAPLIQAEGDGLQLATAVSTDLAAFDQALREGRPDDALALWRGPLADGLTLDDAPAFDEWLTLQREAARRQWLRALELSAAGHEAQGRIELALQRVQALLADDPLQEQRHRDAMRLLAASGRREAALAQYERCLVLLKDELGLQPMSQTVALFQALRDGQSPTGVPAESAVGAGARPPLQPGHGGSIASSVASSVANSNYSLTTLVTAAVIDGDETRTRIARAVSAPLPFFGREAEVAHLEAGWALGHSLLIEGAAGVGKSRLALDFVMSHGPHLLVRSRPGDGEMAYATFARALRALIGPASDNPELQALPSWLLTELTRLLPELGGAPAPLRSDGELLRFTEACCQAWLALAGDNFDAVVFDDWHHADASSRSLLAFIAGRRREQQRGGPREVLISRPADDNPALSQALQQLRSSGRASSVLLAPLSPAAVLQIVQQLSGAASPLLFATRLTQATGGNPFFLAETLRHLAESGLLGIDDEGLWRTPFDDDTRDYRELPMPASVREAVLGRVARLGAASLRLLEAAALAHEPFTPALLAPACALSELEAVLSFEQATQAQLLRAHDAGGYAFAHDLVQHALASSLSSERHRLVHHRLALAAQAIAAAPAVIAQHFESSQQPARAVGHRLAAGQAAAALHAHAEALAHWQRGLDDQPSLSQRVALLSRQLPAARSIGRASDALGQAAQLRQLCAGGLLDPADRHEALMVLALDESRHGSTAQSLALIEQLPAAVQQAQRLRVLNVRLGALHGQGRLDEAAALGAEALALPAESPRDRADLLYMMGLIEHAAGRLAAGVLRIQQYLDLSQQLGDDLILARGHYVLGCFRIGLGDEPGAIEALSSAVQACQRVGNVHIQRLALYNLGVLHTGMTRPQQALLVAQQGWDLYKGQAADGLSVMVRLLFVDVQMALGHVGQALDHVRLAASEVLAVGEPQSIAGTVMSALEVFALTGTLDDALPLLAAIDVDVIRRLPQVGIEMWLVRAEVALLTGAVAAATGFLLEVPAVPDIENQRVRSRARLIRAQHSLAMGHAAQALAELPSDDAPAINDELRLRSMAVRVAGHAALGTLPMTIRDQANAMLANPSAHAVAALLLHRAMAVAHTGQDDAAARALRTAQRAHIERLAGSLQGHPAEQAAMRRLWG